MEHLDVVAGLLSVGVIGVLLTVVAIFANVRDSRAKKHPKEDADEGGHHQPS